MFVFQCFTMLVGYQLFTESITEIYAEGAYATADACATIVDGDLVPLYLEDDVYSDDYDAVVFYMQNLANDQGITYISVILVSDNYTHIKYVFSIEGEDYDFPLYEPGYERDATNEEYIEAYRTVYEEKEKVTVSRGSDSSTGAHITVHVPILNSDGDVSAILYVQKQMSNLTSARLQYLVNIAMITINLMIISVIFLVILMRRQLINPILALNEETRRFVSERTEGDLVFKKLIKKKDEMALISQELKNMEHEIITSQAELIEITAEKERIGAELDIARQIQADMLPTLFPPFPEFGEFDLYATMTPAREVGGDYFDFFKIDDDHVAIIIADVSGKGVPAALFMVITKTLIKDRALMGGKPSEILEYVNSRIADSNGMEMFVTVWCGILTVSTGEIIASNAGHEYPVIRDAEGHYSLFKDKHCFVISGMDGVPYRDYTFKLERGGGIFLYTDGVPEANDENSNLLGEDRMIEILNSCPDKDAESILKYVKKELSAFVGKAEPFDDVTMLFLEYKG